MALLIADLLIEVNHRTGRAESDVNDELKSILHDLTNQGCFLEAEETVTLVTNDADYAFSSFTNDFKEIKTVVIIDSSSIPSVPLDKISWKTYKERLSENLSAGEPLEFCIFPERIGSVLYLSPKPNATNYPSMKISGPIRHADSTTISFPERYRELLIEGLCWQIEKTYNVDSDKTKEHKGYYENEVSKIFADIPTIGQSQYGDI